MTANIAIYYKKLYHWEMKSGVALNYRSFASPTNGFEYLGTTTTQGIHEVRVRHTQPTAVHGYTALSELINLELADGSFERDGSMAEEFAAQGSVSVFENSPKHYPDLCRALGYEAIRTPLLGYEGAEVSELVFRYPTIERLNEFVRGSGLEGGLVFVEYSGGMYALQEGAEAFANGKALVARDQPYQVHEHGNLHVLGLLGLSGDIVTEYQSFIGSVKIRADAEAGLPPVSRLKGSLAEEFLRPAHLLLRALGLQLDQFSNSLGDTVFMSSQGAHNLEAKICHRLAELDQLYNGMFQKKIPYNLISRAEHSKLAQWAQEIIDRYDALDAYAKTIVGSAEAKE